jgi:hypothetical protein
MGPAAIKDCVAPGGKYVFPDKLLDAKLTTIFDVVSRFWKNSLAGVAQAG